MGFFRLNCVRLCLRPRRPKARSFDLKIVAVDSLLVVACRLTSPTVSTTRLLCTNRMGIFGSRVDDKNGTVATLVSSSPGSSTIASVQDRKEKRNKKKQCNRHASEKFSAHRQRLAYASPCRLPDSLSQGDGGMERRHAEPLISLNSQAHSRICSMALSPRTFICPIVCQSVLA